MNRPIKDGAYNRNLVVRLRVNMTEKKKLERMSVEAGLSLSDWIRSQAIDVTPLFSKPNPDREVLLRLLSELGMVGSNINQIAKQMNRKQNSEDYIVPLEVIAYALEGLKTLTTHLREILEHGKQR